ncbi:hypothetical protein EC957_006331 [Mortierella hygrophila]|uniref:Uncharacterized protein n=1 Tax=Mortierella hygrophila TaxID=979708 RepID=A0A9P6EY87_9FUNG|nr:hypothetical protein EC957_006331 [Mortierella hygrophila]
MLLLLNPPTALAEPLPAFNFDKRDNTIYAPSNVPPAAPVTLIAPAARVAPLLVAFVPPAPRPNPNPNVMTNMARPAPIAPAALVSPPAPVVQPANTIPAPVPAAAWTPPANDALTYTSYAGLLSTMAPAFYPTPLNSAAVPSRAISFLMPQQQHPPPPVSVAHAPTLHTVPTPLMAPTVETTPNPNKPILFSPESAPSPTLSASSAVPMEKEKESAAAHTTLSATAAHSSDSTSSSSIDSTSVSKEDTTSLTSTTTSTTTSHDVTVSTTTTTRGDTTSTRTTVGTDGTTTVLTEYPTSTRRTTTSTSGVEAKWPRMQGGRQDPSVGSVVGYLAGLLIPEARWSMTVAAMIVAMALPGAVALLV